MSGWYQRQKQRDQEAEQISRQWLGEEAQVFVTAMEAIDGVLDAAFGGRQIEELPEKAKVAIGYRSRDLLWSSWLEMLAGRYGAATEHWRSIAESPHFIRAITVKPELARQWMNGRLKVETALTTVRDRLRDAGHYEEASKWHRSLAESASMVQAFSHVTMESAVATVPIARSADGQPESFVVGGALSKNMVRMIGIYLAYDAVVTFHTSVFAFQHLSDVSTMWERRGETLYKASVQTLDRLYEETGLSDMLENEK